MAVAVTEEECGLRAESWQISPRATALEYATQ